MKDFEKWLESLRRLMIRTKIIGCDVQLDKSSWEGYYIEGLTPYDTLVEEFGDGFKRRFRRSHIQRIKNQ